MKKKTPRKATPPPTPKQSKPWDPPPLATAGDPGPDVTYAAVGRALSQWETLESNLANLFAAFIGPSQSAVAVALRAYGSIQTFRGRADMLDEAETVFFGYYANPDLQKHIRDFLKLCRNYAPRRNEIAHGIVWTVYWPKLQGTGSALFPARYSSSKNRIVGLPTAQAQRGYQTPVYIYSSVEIGAIKDRFVELTDDAEKIWTETARHRQKASKNFLPMS